MRAQETKTKREYAIKLINKQQIQSVEHATHIVREKDVLLFLSEDRNYCPFLVRAYSSFHD